MTATTLLWVDFGHRNRVLFDHSALLMMKMPFVQIINMAVMFHGRVTTLLPVRVVMVRMGVFRHGNAPYVRDLTERQGSTLFSRRTRQLILYNGSKYS
jgi:hypothetical protein